jgi:hypothetical protein
MPSNHEEISQSSAEILLIMWEKAYEGESVTSKDQSLKARKKITQRNPWSTIYEFCISVRWIVFKKIRIRWKLKSDRELTKLRHQKVKGTIRYIIIYSYGIKEKNIGAIKR